MPTIDHSPRRSPRTRLIRMMLLQPLWAIPFALFFGTLYGPGVKLPVPKEA